MKPSKDDTKRRRDIVAELSLMSRHGWQDSRPSDYQRLEKALAELDRKAAAARDMQILFGGDE